MGSIITDREESALDAGNPAKGVNLRLIRNLGAGKGLLAGSKLFKLLIVRLIKARLLCRMRGRCHRGEIGKHHQRLTRKF